MNEEGEGARSAASTDESGCLALLVDFVLPLLPPYDFAVYVLLLRRSKNTDGIHAVTIGKRSIAEALGKGTRSSRGNYQHISERLAELARVGFIAIGATDRRGTHYTIRLPREVPVVSELMERAGIVQSLVEPNYFTDDKYRNKLFERDGWRCRYCGQETNAHTATLDHIVPQSKGGADTPDNLATCCLMCNSIKAGRTYEEAAPHILRRIATSRSVP